MGFGTCTGCQGVPEPAGFAPDSAATASAAARSSAAVNWTGAATVAEAPSS
ncbi:hypothetical protein P4U43_04735 [Arthrobacter sp. EH-1B-1]|uniref:Uncharacterized protein n=1 Tax=Arthrobacter vasquezii TaxID=2977629 RepID=A0ABT6CSQ7_9MICC|nr:hypothetical protein [Arthrobacter vasquezii]MDF9277097.1 hypothetical protein [Arthrobacter vasquezii]